MGHAWTNSSRPYLHGVALHNDMNARFPQNLAYRKMSSLLVPAGPRQLHMPQNSQAERVESNYKRILVLANSIKKGGRCVVLLIGRGRWNPQGRDWCRPISEEAEGELQPKHMKLEGASALSRYRSSMSPVKAACLNLVH